MYLKESLSSDEQNNDNLFSACPFFSKETFKNRIMKKYINNNTKMNK